MNILLVDDHRIFSDALRALLLSSGKADQVEQAVDARSGLQTLDSFRPDVCLVDVSLPGMNGFALTREILRRESTHQVLILTVLSGREYAAQAIAAGARGFLSKTKPWEEMVRALEAVVAGRIYLPQDVPVSEADHRLGSRGRQGHDDDAIALLTVREREVFDMVISGSTNRDISRQLCISVKTVETHRTKINRKLRVHSSAELVRFAARRGVLPDLLQPA